MSSQMVRSRGHSNIFINYRREDSSGHAGRLFDALNAHFAGRVFMDIDTLEPGVDFAEVIEQAVGSCEVLLVIIGREWLHIKDAAGRRRLDDPADFVRLELESALERSRVIPVLVQGATMPGTEELPHSIARLARRNALELSDARWAYDVDRLVRTIQKILAAKEGATAGAVPTVGSKAWRFSLAAAVLVAVLALSAVLWMRWTPSGNGAPAPAPKVKLAAGSATAPTGGVATGNPAVGEPPPLTTPVGDRPHHREPAPPTREDAASVPSAVEPSRETASAKPLSDGGPARKPARVRTVSQLSHKTPPAQAPGEDGQPSAPSRSTATAAPRPEKTAAAVSSLPRVTITEPAAGVAVAATVQVRGTVADLGEHRAFLCIRQGDGKIYPRGEVFPEANGKWSIQLRSSKEKTFDILVVTTGNKRAAQALSDQKYRDNGLDALPEGGFISSGIIAVKRTGKLHDFFAPG